MCNECEKHGQHFAGLEARASRAEYLLKLVQVDDKAMGHMSFDTRSAIAAFLAARG